MTRTTRTIDRVTAEVYRIPTDTPEADGTLTWDSTTMVVVRATSGEVEGTGWTYSASACKRIIDTTLSDQVIGIDVMAVTAANAAMVRSCRNMGRPGLVACAISAVDIALWDLKARVLDVGLADLFGRARDSVPIYGSGGFTTYSDEETASQLRTWVEQLRIPRVKIKIGEDEGAALDRDLRRIELARHAVGSDVELFVDANGGYTRKQAIRQGRAMAEFDVHWFEEPVSSDDLVGLREVRDQCEADVAAGEYGYTPAYFANMITAEAVDCLQADATRCGGYTGWLAAANVAQAHQLELSAHCAPNVHAPVAISAANLRHVEYFHDHYRIEEQLFEGALSPVGGVLVPRADVPGHGMTLCHSVAQGFHLAEADHPTE
jgi:L-alanine-DL-glutamate epimerase-like enolase superfamily enzyme